MDGKLIVFEGVEGCGKTSQMQLCSQWLESLGISVLLTREPGGTELGLDIRRLLLEKTDNKQNYCCMLLTDRNILNKNSSQI
jgi:dTMP kinase